MIHKPTPRVTINATAQGSTLLDYFAATDARDKLRKACEVPFLFRAIVDPPSHVDVTVRVGLVTTPSTTTCDQVKKVLGD